MTEQKFELRFLMENVAFGLTDGIICFLAIMVDMARATLGPKLVIAAAREEALHNYLRPD